MFRRFRLTDNTADIIQQLFAWVVCGQTETIAYWDENSEQADTAHALSYAFERACAHTIHNRIFTVVEYERERK